MTAVSTFERRGPPVGVDRLCQTGFHYCLAGCPSWSAHARVRPGDHVPPGEVDEVKAGRTQKFLKAQPYRDVIATAPVKLTVPIVQIF
jgi:hypothetical protein